MGIKILFQIIMNKIQFKKNQLYKLSHIYAHYFAPPPPPHENVLVSQVVRMFIGDWAPKSQMNLSINNKVLPIM